MSMGGKRYFIAVWILTAALALTACKADSRQDGGGETGSTLLQDNLIQDSGEKADTQTPDLKQQAEAADGQNNDDTAKQAEKEDAGSDTPTGEPAETVTDPLIEAIFEGKDAAYREMIERSLISTGNNARMKKAIKKAEEDRKSVV